jgi:GNAT superfamily N-acetyltransferase
LGAFFDKTNQESIIAMIKTQLADKKRILEILSRSLVDNQSGNYIIRQEEKKTQRIRALMDHSYEICGASGDVWLSDVRQACALILHPHQKKTTIRSILLDLQLIFKSFGLSGIRKTLHREGQIKQLQRQVEMHYHWFSGVDLDVQHEGIGTHLISEVTSKAGEENLLVFLETSTLKNLPWYERLGFQIYGQLDLGHTLYFLKREPDK